jgi:hypothetical protein
MDNHPLYRINNLLSMILLWAFFIGLAATILRARLHHRTLKLEKLRWEWLVFVSVIPQIIMFQFHVTEKWIPEALVPGIYLVSMAGLVVFALINVVVPGFWALALGLFCNFLVIVLNGGWMPISTETLARMVPSQPENSWVIGSRLDFTKDRIFNSTEINLAWLSDRFLMPKWIPLNIAFSLGDIFISIGAILLLWSLSSTKKEKE